LLLFFVFFLLNINSFPFFFLRTFGDFLISIVILNNFLNIYISQSCFVNSFFLKSFEIETIRLHFFKNFSFFCFFKIGKILTSFSKKFLKSLFVNTILTVITVFRICIISNKFYFIWSENIWFLRNFFFIFSFKFLTFVF